MTPTTRLPLVDALRLASQRDVFNLAYKSADDLEEAAALIEKQGEVIAALSKALSDIAAADDTGPMMFEETEFMGYKISQAVGGSEGKFAAVARAALLSAKTLGDK